MGKLSQNELRRYRKYHTPNCGNLTSIKLNAIFINKNNTREHEKTKFDLAWEHEKYLTEAARVATEEERKIFNLKKDKVVDFVDLTTGEEIEIVNKHESDEQIAFYRKFGITPIIVDPMRCTQCGHTYPRRNRGQICQLCKKE